ncbi:THUMP-like domain-containing protein [Capnocytophaga gingivalis]
MLNYQLVTPEVQAYLQEHLWEEAPKFALKKSPFSGVSASELAQQLLGRQKAKEKLPLWHRTQGIYYPVKLSLEQASSEATARYKASLVTGHLLDATGGFGVDDYFFAQRCKSVTHCELQEELSEIVAHNFAVLGADIHCVAQDSYAYLASEGKHYDVIYLDPARRDTHKRKVFFLEDCTPDVPHSLDFLWQYTDTILLKASPMLDISRALTQLPQAHEIHIVAIEGEVKELLFLLRKTPLEGEVQIKAVNMLSTRTDIFSFFPSEREEIGVSMTQGVGCCYLYEPNAALLKGNGLFPVARAYELAYLNKDSQLLLAKDYIPDFPGRVFLIDEILPYDRKLLKSEKITQANITVRNFPMKVAEIRERFSIAEGGNCYLFFTLGGIGNKLMIICRKPFV